MSSDNFIVIQGWMCNELNLKGNDLLVYALINGFSQDGKSKYYGGRAYIANTFNISLPTVDKALQNLINANLIVKEPCKTQAETDVYYINISSKETLLGKNISSKETLLNNIDTSKKENIDNFTNVKLEQPTVTQQPKRRIKLVDTPNDSVNEDTVKNTVNQEKPKKKNLYQSCVEQINEFSKDNAKLKNKLMGFLNMRIELKNKPFGSKTFKGYLDKLEELSNDSEEQIKIIQQSIDRQYQTFYEVKRYNNYKRIGEQDQSVFSEYGKVKSEHRENEVVLNVSF